ncbi:hypothetical protein AXK57_17905 [Tsukamurella pulmonis]|uniref:hypothetical protein n=1 Tax=Tsukamurella pulmonis TaxID=47312 RepID=UPI00079A295D|nr:hypothetical protein [Tsukamurella pulmonis]KXP08327.1 hypothetical protein AXK57_17905 [Tsukamurella pulmonis]RDH10232.1 hypothetical protein DVB88_19090 [Tsukamurella pulmonis]
MAHPPLARPAPSTGTERTVLAYGLGAAATAAGLGYALADGFALGGLERHLHALYDPVGKYGESAPLYGYLVVVGVVGLLCWWANLRWVRRRAATARRRGAITLGVAAIPVLAPVFLQEYGQPVIPLSLAAGYLVAWSCGLLGVLLLRRPGSTI